MRLCGKNGYWLLAVGLLLILCCISLTGGASRREEVTTDVFSIISSFGRENGQVLEDRTVRFVMEGRSMEYRLDGGNMVHVSGLPRVGDFTLTILDEREQVQGSMSVSVSEGAVIDANTDENGVGHITLKQDTNELALHFLLKEDGTVSCALQLVRA